MLMYRVFKYIAVYKPRHTEAYILCLTVQSASMKHTEKWFGGGGGNAAVAAARILKSLQTDKTCILLTSS